MKYSIYDIDLIRIYVEKSQNLPYIPYADGMTSGEAISAGQATYHFTLEEKVRTTMSDSVEMTEIHDWFEDYFKEQEKKMVEDVASQKERLSQKKVLSWEYKNTRMSSLGDYPYYKCSQIVSKDIDSMEYARKESVDVFSNRKRVPERHIKNLVETSTDSTFLVEKLRIEERYKEAEVSIRKVMAKSNPSSSSTPS